MTFSYLITEDIGKLRFEIGDTVESNGPRPDNRNFSNEELQHVLDEEETTGRAAARLCEILVKEWSKRAGTERLGPRGYARNQAKAFAAEAERLRRLYGYPEAAAGNTAGFNTRYTIGDA